jgi:hypothetical protein
MISKSLSTSRKFAQLPKIAGELGEFCQVLFPLIVAHADDYGRLQGDAFTIKFQVFPISPRSEEDFDAAIRHLDTARLIEVYEANGDKFIQVLDFDKHQSGLHKKTESKIPEPPGISRNFPENPGSPGNLPESPGTPGNPREFPGQLKRTELNRTEEKGTEGKVASLLPVPRAVGHPSRKHGLQTLHRTGHQAHSWCSERICVPSFLHERFIGAVGGNSPDLSLKAFYGDTVRDIPDSQPIESDPVKFWPPLVSARWPPVSQQVGTRTAALQRATAEFLRGGQ